MCRAVMRRAALRRPIDLYDVRKFDAALGASLERLAAAHRAWAAAGLRSAPLLVDGTPIEDLCLSFVLPGAPPSPSAGASILSALVYVMLLWLAPVKKLSLNRRRPLVALPICCDMGVDWKLSPYI